MSQDDQSPIFAIVPIEVAMDRRLTGWHIRVLIALFSFRRKNTETIWPSRQKLAARTGLHITNISKTTTELVELGWLEKVGAGGRGQFSEYRIRVPETVAELTTVSDGPDGAETVVKVATVATSATVASSATRTVAVSATSTRTRTEQGTEKKKNTRPPEVPEDVWNDWLEVRRAKRAGAITGTVMAAMEREAGRAGISLADAVRECAERNWVGLRAEWLQNSARSASRHPTPTAFDRQAEVVARLTGGLMGKPATDPRTIDVELTELPAPRLVSGGR